MNCCETVLNVNDRRIENAGMKDSSSEKLTEKWWDKLSSPAMIFSGKLWAQCETAEEALSKNSDAEVHKEMSLKGRLVDLLNITTTIWWQPWHENLSKYLFAQTTSSPRQSQQHSI